ncbi:MAG: pyridoxal phosphate-dependent aminotransferase [Oligoflexia bacterium]|nr:pyridoxal phosphate-dependent aminotransferase [Oligoflexia bacterium]
MKIANWTKTLGSSPTMAVNQKVIDLKAQGKRMISLVVGEPDFDTPQFIKDACVESLAANQTRYTGPQGILPLREAIAQKLKRDNNVEYSPVQIIVTCGAKQAIAMALAVAIDPGDEVLIPSPYWVSYPAMVQLARGVPVTVPTYTEDRYKLSIKELEKAVTNKTRAIIINYPSNPTGVVYDRNEILEIATWCTEKGITIISDEVYEKIMFYGKNFTCTAGLSKEIYDNTITINGLSKSHCMTGWRMGYAAAPRDFIAAMNDYQSQFNSHITTFVQYASIAALKDDSFIQTMVEAYQDRVEFSIDLIKKHMPECEIVKPDGAFYLFPAVGNYYGREFNGKRIENSVDLATLFLDEVGVATVPGIAFGHDENIRLSVATSKKELQEGIEKMGSVVSNLK